jgi:hypothetical protein
MSPVHASIMAVLIRAALVTVAPGAEENCPSSAQVQAALEAHAPRLVAPRLERGDSDTLVLAPLPTLATGAMSISLIDKNGLVKLYRLLPQPAGDRARDCPALADTVAFIVDRYFDEVELPNLPERRLPPSLSAPPPPAKEVGPRTKVPKFALSGTVGKRTPGGPTDLGGIEFKLAGGSELGDLSLAGGHPWVDLSAGIVGIARESWHNESRSATVVRTGADLSLLLGWRVWHGRLYAGPQISVEMVWLNWEDSEGTGQGQREIRFDTAAGLRTGYQYFWQRFFARADVTACAAIVRHRVSATSAPATSLFEAPPAYLTLAFGIGIWF